MTEFADDLVDDAPEAIRLVSGMLRRGEAGEAFRERRQAASWSATEAGLSSPAFVEERGTAVRIHRGRESLLIARAGDGPLALREAVREAARRAGGSPFFKAARAADRRIREAAPVSGDGEEERTAALAAALARAVPDPRGVSVSLVVSRVSVARAVVTPREALRCGTTIRLEASGTVGRAASRRGFAYQSARPWREAVEGLATALARAIRPVARLTPPAGETGLVLAPAAAAAFWHEVVGHPLESDGAERASVLARVPGAAVAPPGVDVRSDPTRAGLPGAYAVDDEGVVARAVPLLAQGRVADVLRDRRSGGAASNGHGRTSDYRRPPRARMSNLVVAPGRLALEELVERCGSGLLVEEISAGMADPESGRFVLLVESAVTIRRGRAGSAVAPFALTGDILRALHGLDPELGNRPLPASGLGLCVKGGDALPVGGTTPAILVRGLAVRGGRR